MKKLIRIAVLVVVVAGGGLAAWMTFGPSEAAVEVATVPVTRGNLEETVLASGALEANSVTSVGAEVSGTVKSVAVKLGDAVKAGDTIAEIDSLNQENAVKSAEASLANMNAQRRAKVAEVTQDQQAMDRATQLQSQRLMSDADFVAAKTTLDSAQANLDALDAQISQAQLAVDSANLDLSRTKITAPVAGTVVAVLVTEGQSISASQTAPTIVKIANLDTMIIKAQISEADVTRVLPGQAATFTILGEPDNRIDATLRSIDPAPTAIDTADNGLSSSDNAVYYNGLFEVPNPDHKLRIAMTAQVTIVVDAANDALLVPASALGTIGRDGLYHVNVYDAATGKSKPVTVTVGLDNNITAEVVSGLSEGDAIVTAATKMSTSTPATSGRRAGGLGF